MAAIDVIYVAKRQIAPTYLADAAIQLALLGGLAAAGRRTRAHAGRHGGATVVRINDAFRLGHVDAARSIFRLHPFATIVTEDLRATHMPCLLDDPTTTA